MCRTGDDHPELCRAKKQKARKTHVCDECGRTIGIGETYESTFMVFEGNPETFRTCAHCLVGQGWLIENCKAFVFTEVGDDLEEHAQEYPKLDAPLRAICDGMRRRWRTEDAHALMPIPDMPPPISEAWL